MKKYILPILAAMLLCGAKVSAQTDSRNRTAETIVVDGLAQLPTNSSEAFKNVMGELASTGDKGVLQIASRLVPPAKGKNAVYEYALSGITDFVTTKDGQKYRASVRKGLAEAIEKNNDADNKAFLMQMLAKCATADDMSVFAKYLSDAKMGKYAIAAVTAIPGNDTELAYLVKNSSLPHNELAKIAALRKLQGVEDVLLSWTAGADAATLNEIYNALAKVGTVKSVKTLAAAAKKAQYAPDTTNATFAYATLLSRVEGNAKTVQAGAKALQSSKTSAVRCAGVGLMLKSAGIDGGKTLLAALKDKSMDYRNAALAYARQYSGNDVAKVLTQNFGKLSAPAKIDVMRWFGNTHAKESESVVIASMKSADATLAREAIAAASKIGGNNLLAALVAQVGGTYAAETEAALLSFNGKINSEIVKTLATSKDNKVLASALAIAGKRHIHEAYSAVVTLTASGDAAISSAAYNALVGVASPAAYADVCMMLDNASGSNVKLLQQAAATAIAAQSADKQFDLVSASMAQSKHPEYYYTMLAQSGSEKAIDEIVKGMKQANTKAAATEAMLQVNNPAVLPIVTNLARTMQGDTKEQLIAHANTLIEKSEANPVVRYQQLRNLLDLKPSDAETRRSLGLLGATNTVQALNTMQNYLDVQPVSRAAAEAVRAIIARNDALNGGNDVRTLMNNANKVFARDKAAGDADAGYAMDDVNGLLAKTAENGATLASGAITPADAAAKYNKVYENVALSFDWKNTGETTISLRGVPMLKLGKNAAGTMAGALADGNAEGEWNTMEIRLVDDRIFVTNNGENIVVNAPLTAVSGAKSVPATGKFEIRTTDGALELRDLCLTELPSTPVYELSAEEKKAGFEVLFDGRSLEKWQGNTDNYVPENGTIFVTANYGGSGNLYTKKKYSDFIYRFEFNFVQPGVNNGVGVRTNIGTDAAYDGMEIQVLDHDDPIYADLNPYQQHGAVYGIIVPKHVVFGKHGTWNTEEIRLIGDRITVTVNGEVILDGNIREACKGHNVAPDGSDHNPYTVDHKNHPGLFNKDGYISFCGHGPGVKFRNVRILDLSKSSKPAAKSAKKRR